MRLHTFSDNFLAKSSFCQAPTNGTTNGAAVDCLGYRRAAFVLDASPGAVTTVNYQLQDSPDNSAWTTITGGTLGAAVAASQHEVHVVNIDLAKRQRYIRAQLIGTGTAGAAAGELLLGVYINAAPTQDFTPQSI